MEIKKVKIMEVAEKLFSELGYEATSTRKLAAEAKVNLAMISYYFGSKKGLFEEILKQKSDSRATIITEIYNKNISPVDKLDQIIAFYVERFFDNRNIYTILYRELSLQQRSSLNEFILRVFTKEVEILKESVKAASNTDTIDKIDIDLSIFSIYSTIIQIVVTPSLFFTYFGFDSVEEFLKPSNLEGVKIRVKKHLMNMVKLITMN